MFPGCQNTSCWPRHVAIETERKTFFLTLTGTAHLKGDQQEVRQAVKAALDAGYRHIDTALAYGNEQEVGQGIKDSGVPRSEIWITTKLDNTWHHVVEEGITSSLKSLDTDYVDLYLMHWPSSTNPEDKKKHLPDWDFVKTW